MLARAAPWLRPPPFETLVEGICASRDASTSAATATSTDEGMAEGSQEQHDIPQIQEPVKQDDRERLHQIAQRHLQSGAEDDVPSLRIKSLAGLDISAQDLAFSIAATAPQPQPTPYVYSPDSLPKNREGPLMIDLSEIRWENLEAKIWHGSLEVVNPEFIGTECITAMEVIEHLPPQVFPTFAPTILGIYHPKYLLVTTPSYTFNGRFSALMQPESESSSSQVQFDTPQPIGTNARAGGYLDPTGRTDRIFRHSDHKFEMTLDEFEEWCSSVAAEFGYEVKTWTIGTPLEKDPWGRDEQCGRASQVAEFVRKDGQDLEKQRDEAVKRYHQTSRSTAEPEPHVLLSHTSHPAHPCAQRPIPMHQVTSLVYSHMLEMRETFLRVEELWLPNNYLAMACGGWVEWLTAAVDACGEVPTGVEELSVTSGESGQASGQEKLLLIKNSSALLSPSFAEQQPPPYGIDTTQTTDMLRVNSSSSEDTLAKRSDWTIKLVTSRTRSIRPSWNPSAETSFDSIPEGWMPEEESRDFTYEDEGIDESVARHGDSWDVIHEVEEESTEWGERTMTADEIAGLDGEERDTRRDSSHTILATGQGWGDAGTESNPWSEDDGQGTSEFDPESYGHGWGNATPGGSLQSPWGRQSELADHDAAAWGRGDEDVVGKEEDWGKVDTPVLGVKGGLEPSISQPQVAPIAGYAEGEPTLLREKTPAANS